TAAGKTVFVFPGQGSQWLGMGMGLHAGYPVFAEAFNTVVGELDRHLLRPLREVMWGHDENLLNSTEFAQPALFAVEVALFRLLGSWGVRPDFVMGHSIGELSAAHVAGVLSLENAAVLVAARGRLMQALPAGGAMVAVQAAEEEVRPLLSAEVDIAAVNGPASLVISGAQNAVAAVADQLRADGRRVHQLAVSHAFHSPLMDPMIDEFAAVAAGIAIGRPTIGIISNVTGQLAGDDFGSAAYWRRHIRQAVRFADSVRFAQAAGGSRFLEVGPSGGLVASIEESLPDVAVTTMSALRKDRPEPATLTNAVAQGFVTGMDLDWRAVVGEAQFVELPTYAFQRRRFWLSGDGVAADAAGLGLAASEHALLGAVIDLPASGGVVLTGRLSPSVQGWLADHSVAGVTIFPGAGFVELAIRAGDEVGCGVVDELTLAAPLVLPASGSVAVQVVVNGPDESGVRGVSVYSRGDVGTGWVLHAEGALRAGSAEPTADLAMWPPAGAVPVEVADGYQQLAERGYGYGPAFRGLTAMWRRGDEVFAEVALPADAGVSVTGFGVHPVLLDAALHAVVLSAESAERGQGSVLVPFSWQGVSLHAAGASAVRARIAPVGPSAVSIELADGLGLPVLSVASMLARPVTDQQLRAAVSSSGPDRLFEVTWSPQPSAAVEPLPVCAWGTTEDSAAVVFESVPLAGDVVAGVYAATSSVLDVLQSWLTRDGAGVLVVMTRGAVALPGEDVTDLAGAAVWGLVRSAQTEHPGRIVLVDSDAPLDDSALAAVVTTGEPQVLWRRGEVYTARVHGSRAVGGLLVPPSDRPWRLAMSTAGTFENLRLELIPDADAPLGPGQVRVAVSAIAANFRDVMIALGLYPDPDAVMGVEACGVVIETSLNKGSFAVGDRVMGLFPEGTGTVASTDQRLLVKVPAGWSHTAAATTSVVFATAHYALVDLAAARSGQRVLIHAGTGGVGMAAVQLARHLGLEVFATHRRAHGLPAISLGWGLWDQASAMTGGLATVDFKRFARDGIVAMSSADALQLFDTAMIVDEPFMLPAHIDFAALKVKFDGGTLPPMFVDLINAPTRRQVDDSLAAAKSKSALLQRLEGLPEDEQHAVLLDLVRSHIATVLGSASPEAIDPDRAFQELGFDSLTAVEMRNRLKSATGLALSPTLIFDYPNSAALAGYMRRELLGSSPQDTSAVAAGEAELQRIVASIPVKRLRQAGVLDLLLALANETETSGQDPALAPTAEQEIADMDLDDLVNAAFRNDDE
ncbi:acyltransferase domain-containing protein, partial [Mycobacterium canetti]|uniref:acyltransferase domain-containing protein n=1 Tax=Mycobacterium canetti TaxID=78331 RepID=UPI001E5B81CD